MKDKPLFGCPNRPAALIAAMAAALLLAPGTVFAQGAYYQFYNLALGIENVSPADSQYTEAFADLPAPGVTSTNLAITGDFGSAAVSASVSYGELQVSAGCSLNRPDVEYGDFNADFADDNLTPSLAFYDALTVTSDTLPAGTPVLIQISSVYYGFISPATNTVDPDDALDGTQSSASAGLELLGIATTNGVVGGVVQTNVMVLTYNTQVGAVVSFSASVTIYGQAYSGDEYSAFSGAVSTGVTNAVYVDLLSPGEGYTAASGTVYPALTPPNLAIAQAGDRVTVSWPNTKSYTLQQNSTLAGGGWTTSGYSITTRNGNNSITITPPPGNLFFRLASP
jgi:hypothetical protein